ncbi:hypothetical protein PoB_004202100 [Plakobranchus ocellatus]|uniref:Uncharacterized protein n=1 Tax=Plakobranchus ocellatus TaxID=259542 RepID=A0AAV4B515_9GAST|nr:hypothetical protein PoB_004202100 [Plakobranchus ocellatus]
MSDHVTYHRFDGLPAVSSPCSRDGRFVKQDKIGIKICRYPERRISHTASRQSTRGGGSYGLLVISMCSRADYACTVLDSNGYIFRAGTTSHISTEYPWLANRLMVTDSMKALWCVRRTSSDAQLQYTLAFNTSGDQTLSSRLADDTTASTPDCRKFVLFPVARTNMLVLILASRLPGQCPPESLSLLEACSTGKPRSLRSMQSLSSSTLCVFCPSASEIFSQRAKVINQSLRAKIGVSDPGKILRSAAPSEPSSPDVPANPPPTSVQPRPPAPFDPTCPRSCSEMLSQSDCEAHSAGCVWDQTESHPVCLLDSAVSTTLQTTILALTASRSSNGAMTTTHTSATLAKITVSSGQHTASTSTSVVDLPSPTTAMLFSPTAVTKATTASAKQMSTLPETTLGTRGASQKQALSSAKPPSVAHFATTKAVIAPSGTRVKGITSSSSSLSPPQVSTTSKNGLQLAATTFTATLYDKRQSTQNPRKAGVLAGIGLACVVILLLASCAFYRMVYLKWTAKHAQFADQKKLYVDSSVAREEKND